MRHQEALAALKRSAAQGSTIPPRDLRVKVVLEAFKRQSTRKFATFFNVEFKPLLLLNRKPLAGTVLEPFAEALKQEGIAEPRFGDVMREFGLDRSQMNRFACFCHNGESICGATAASVLETILNPRPIPRDENRFRYLSQED